MKNKYSSIGSLCLLLLFLLMGSDLHADETLELKTTIIKGNKEVPQMLFIVPWQNTKSSDKKEAQKLILHSLFGDLFDPMLPGSASHDVNIEK